ncbi:MAG TPA: CopD family protein, partial [Actinomycetota bacterium]
LDAGGNDVAEGELSTQGRTLTTSVRPGLPDGAYTVAWRVVSSADGHPTTGSFAFGIGAPPPDTGGGGDQGSPPPSPLSVWAKTELYAGVMLLLAVGVVGLGRFRGRPSSLPVVAAIGAMLATLGAVLLLIAEQRSLGVSMSDLVRSDTGRPYLWLLGAVLVADVFVAVGAARARSRPALWGAAGAAAAAMLVRATSGHAAAADPPGLQEGLQWAHFLAAGVWIGGLVLLFLLARDAGHPPVEEARRFSALAGWMVAVVVVTGFLRAWNELGGAAWVLRAFESSYGTTLLIKVAVVIAVIGLAAVNRYRTLPRLRDDARPLRRVAGTEALAAVAVLLLTATLTGFNPNAGADTAPPAPTSVTAQGSDFATTMRVRLMVTPGTPGPNRFDARVVDFDTGTPLPVDAVSVRLRSVTRPTVPAQTVRLRLRDGTWTADSAALSLAGTWEGSVTVRTGASASEVPLSVVTRQAGATQEVSAQPGLPVLVTTSFPGGVVAQTFVDPGVAGTNQVHVTYFGADGTGLRTDRIVVVASTAGGLAQRLPSEPFGPGHVIANATLEPGAWTFDVVATTPQGEVYQATWTEAIEEAP